MDHAQPIVLMLPAELDLPHHRESQGHWIDESLNHPYKFLSLSSTSWKACARVLRVFSFIGASMTDGIVSTKPMDLYAMLWVRLKKAAFQFKRRYLAEAMMMDDAAGGVANVTTNSSSNGSVGTGAAGALASPFGGVSSVDYDAAWRSGSELSDAYESDDAAGPPAREMESHAGGGLAGRF